MRIAAHLGVLDEIELIAPAIEHLYRIGVDHVIAFDMGSTDGTLDILSEHAGDGFELVRLSNSTPWDELHRLTVESIRAAAADWVLLLDADEFWLPASGSLRDCAALRDHDLVTVDRFNVVLTEHGLAMPDAPGPADYSTIQMYTRADADFRKHIESNAETAWISGVPVAKVMGRSALVESVAMGGHDITAAPGQTVRRGRAQDLVIAHVPFSGFERFKRRTANIRAFFELNENYFQGAQGWHWRRLYELTLQGREREEFDRQVVDEDALAALRASGSVRSAAQVLGIA